MQRMWACMCVCVCGCLTWPSVSVQPRVSRRAHSLAAVQRLRLNLRRETKKDIRHPVSCQIPLKLLNSESTKANPPKHCTQTLTHVLSYMYTPQTCSIPSFFILGAVGGVLQPSSQSAVFRIVMFSPGGGVRCIVDCITQLFF